MARILIADDDPSIRTMLKRTLDDLGQIVLASDGAMALQSLQSEHFDVVLLDLHMPGIDGFAVLDALAPRDGPNADAALIVITADPTAEARAHAFKARALYFVAKPLSLMMLKTFVTAALKKKKG